MAPRMGCPAVSGVPTSSPEVGEPHPQRLRNHSPSLAAMPEPWSGFSCKRDTGSEVSRQADESAVCSGSALHHPGSR